MKNGEMYDPELVGSFRMMFGFKQPTGYPKYKYKEWAVTRLTKDSPRNKKKLC